MSLKLQTFLDQWENKTMKKITKKYFQVIVIVCNDVLACVYKRTFEKRYLATRQLLLKPNQKHESRYGKRA